MSEHSGSRRVDVLQEEAPHLIADAAPSPTRGVEGTPWVSVELERATERDRPYGWIVTVRTPAGLSCSPRMTYEQAKATIIAELDAAVRTPIARSLALAEPLPPSRRDAT